MESDRVERSRKRSAPPLIGSEPRKLRGNLVPSGREEPGQMGRIFSERLKFEPDFSESTDEMCA